MLARNSKATASPSWACFMASASVKLLMVCFASNFSISFLSISRAKCQPAQTSASFRSSALPQEIVPTVPGLKPAVEEVIAFLAGNFEADVTKAFSRDNGLLTLAANDYCSEFHRSPPQLCLLFLLGETLSPHGTCSLLLPARPLLAEASTSSKRCPRNFSSSSLERNRNSVQESTSSTQPSN
jgi:hypothetical protein